MKTIFQLLVAGLLLGGLASCQKSYTCTCTYLENQAAQKVIYKLDPSNRNNAENDCDNKAFLLRGKESVSCSISK